MAIQFILGASGTGKTDLIYDKMICESMVEGHSPILFLLPEQSNMAAEQDMVSKHPLGGTMDISILSFTRLAFQVFDELNIHTNDILDDYGKSMLLMKILKEKEGELAYYKNMIGKQGFVEEMKSILSEFYQYQITEDVLAGVIAGLSPDKSLYYKLVDLKLLLHAFNEEMEGSYMVAEQMLSLLKEVASESQMLKGAEIYFDGFTGFTPVQYDVIGELMQVCSNLYFSFTMDENIFGDNAYNEQGLFALGKQSVDRLCQLATEKQITVLPHLGLSDNRRLQGKEELLHLERQLFRFPAKSYNGEQEGVRIISAIDGKQEAVFVANMIKEYVVEKGYHYKDFAIITGDLREQSALWTRTMEALEIPCFIDCSETLAYNPIVELVGMLMEVFRSDFSYESVFALLKTGFFKISKSRIYNLENYALKFGVRGYSRWKRTFKRKNDMYASVDETRKEFMGIIEELAKVYSKDTALAKEYIQALYDFMSTGGMAYRLHGKSIWLEEKGYLREARAYAQAYEKFVSVLDKTMNILGEETINRDDFMDVLLTGISDVKLGVIPSTLDQVLIGDVERTRLHHVKIVFVVGANDGLLPKISSGKGILVDKDRRQLQDMNITLAPDSKAELSQQQFYLYLQMSQAQEQVVVVYRQADARGAELRPSYFVKRIQQIFPKLGVTKAEDYLIAGLPFTQQEMVSCFARQLAFDELGDASIYNAMQVNNRSALSNILKGYFYHNQAEVLERAIARKLYGEHMIHNVSRLEAYSGCAYQFFLRYGLGLTKREEYKMESNNLGTILHTVMEEFFSKVGKGEITLADITQDQIEKEATELTLQAAMKENETIFESSHRYRHQLAVLTRIAKRSIENLCKQLSYGDMTPAYLEYKFKPEDKLQYINMALSDGVRMELKGVIDRVDIKVEDDVVYVKVIDYKSGAKDIDFIKMYEGKQLQLAVYTSVMLEWLQREYPDKTIIPTGMYYYHIFDPIVDEANLDKLEDKREAEYRLTGLANEDENCRILMDGKTGKVAPVRYKTGGELHATNNSLVTTEEIAQISNYVRDKMIAIGEEIIQGKIPMNPEKGEHNSPCNYCDYKSVCRFEAGLGGNSYRVGTQMDKHEAKKCITEQMMEENSKEGGEDA